MRTSWWSPSSTTWLSGPSRGDVTLCRLPEHSESETYLKRVAAIPGDTYAIRGGVAYLNGEVADEPYATGTEGCEDFEITLAENEYLVLGDNRMESYDSRAADVGVLSRVGLHRPRPPQGVAARTVFSSHLLTEARHCK